MICSVCSSQASMRRVVKTDGTTTRVGLCNPCANALAKNPEIKRVELVDDGTHGATLPDSKGVILDD
jgi:hypothetical protein